MTALFQEPRPTAVSAVMSPALSCMPSSVAVPSVTASVRLFPVAVVWAETFWPPSCCTVRVAEEGEGSVTVWRVVSAMSPAVAVPVTSLTTEVAV